MPDLKKVCNPCPNMIDKLKPRKIINILPDIDMWVVCEDGYVEKAQEELSVLLKKCNMCTSDVDPISTLEDITQVSIMLKNNIMHNMFLPIDSHIIEYSKLKKLIQKVPKVLDKAKKEDIVPYLPIQPKSYRKQWQYDDEAYNFIYDFLSAFTEYNFPKDLQQSLNNSRAKVSFEHTPDELFDFLLKSANKSNFRRFQSSELEEIILKKVKTWQLLKQDDRMMLNKEIYEKTKDIDIDNNVFEL